MQNLTPQYTLAKWTQGIQPSIMQTMLEATKKPGMISFALGLPDPELFPIGAYQESITRLFSSNSKILQYSPSISSLKQHIMQLMNARGIKCSEEQIFLTAGAQQAVSMLSRLLLDEGSSVVAEALTYPGFYQIVAPHRPNIINIPTHFQNGIDLDGLEAVLQEQKNKPAFIYIVPEGHNPFGSSMSISKKQQLAQLSRKYDVPVIEDDAYGFVYYDKLTPAIRAYEDQWVFYIGTFSKTIAPSMRVGWMVVPEALMQKLAYIKEATDINTATLGQHIISDFLSHHSFDHHLLNLKKNYQARRDAMAASILDFFPEETKMSTVNHGFFIWVELPSGLNSHEIFKKALEHNVAFMPGHVFSIEQKYASRNGMRLNFSHSNLSLIEQGMQKIGDIVKAEYSKTMKRGLNTKILADAL